MNIKVSKNDIVKMLSDKLGMDQKDIELELVGCGEPTPAPVAQAEAPVAQEEQEDEGCDCGSEITNQTTPAELVNITKINKVLEKALTDMGYANKIPKDVVKVCTEAMTEFLEKMNRKEKKIFTAFIGQKDFKAFSLLWQEVQTLIQKKVK